MPRAIWNDVVVAESDRCIEVEGNIYFPPDSVNHGYLAPSRTSSVCPWKGIAGYYDVTVKGETIKDAAWSYPEPKEAAAHFKGYISFWRGVEIEA